MTTQEFEQAKREFAEKWMPMVRYKDKERFIECITALLEQHKEMMLREELIKYDHWAARQLIGSSEVLTAEQAVGAYLEELKNVKKPPTPTCAYRESTGGCIPGCGTDSCMYHPNNR